MMRITLITLVLVLSACASTKDVAKPFDLKKIANLEVKLDKQWSASFADQKGLTGLRPLIAASRVFIGDRDGVVKAFDSEGETLWEVDTELRLAAGPALADGALVFGTLDGQVLALEARDGAQRWQQAVSSEVVAPPVGDRNLIVLRSGDGRVYALAPQDGERLWTADRSVPALTLRGSGTIAMNDAAVFLGMDNGRVIALNRETGEPNWEEAVSLPTGRTEIERIVDVDADLLLVDRVLFAASYGGDMVALSADNGRAIWRRSLASYTGMAFDGQCLYVTDVDSVLWCLDPANGGALWEQDQLKYRGLSTPLALSDFVVVSDYKGYLHVLSGDDGKIVGRRKLNGDAVKQAPQASDGQIYVIDRDGFLRAARLELISDEG